MKEIQTILKWILMILFFPLSLLFVAYFRQRKAKKEYYKRHEKKL
jgi:preprotein translocase subunit YajC